MKNSLIIILLALLSSCASVNRIRTAEQPEKLAPTSAESIKVFSTEKADKAYSIIGKVVAAADAGNNASRPVELLKKEAAYMGADAIVNLRLEITTGYWTTGIVASGTAVKYLNN